MTSGQRSGALYGSTGHNTKEDTRAWVDIDQEWCVPAHSFVPIQLSEQFF
jgi:hypothetical protein